MKDHVLTKLHSEDLPTALVNSQRAIWPMSEPLCTLWVRKFFFKFIGRINNVVLSVPIQYTYEPRHEKICLRGLRPGKTQTGLLSWWDQPGSSNFGYSKKRYYTIDAANNKGADQTARMRRLICAFVVRIWQKQVLSWCGSYSHHRCKMRNKMVALLCSAMIKK